MINDFFKIAKFQTSFGSILCIFVLSKSLSKEIILIPALLA